MSPGDRYRLSEERNEEIFRAEIVPEHLSQGEPQQRPVAYLLGGQPGSGKTRVQQALMHSLADRGGAVEIVGDEFRLSHPAYDELMESDDRSMATHTAADSGKWVEKAISYAAERRVNMVIEGTMRNPDVVEQTATDLRSAGYRVEAVVVATPEAQSRLGILHRYQSIRIQDGAGRYTTPEAHDSGVRGVVETADRLDGTRCVDAVHVHRRDGTLLYENQLTGEGTWQHQPGTRKVIEAERARPWSADETATFDRTVARVRDPDVPEGGSKQEWQSPQWQAEVDSAVTASARNRPDVPAEEAGAAGGAVPAPPAPPDVDRVRLDRSGRQRRDWDAGGRDTTDRGGPER